MAQGLERATVSAVAAASRAFMRNTNVSFTSRWFVNPVLRQLDKYLTRRVAMATQLVERQVKKNISIPVGRAVGKNGRLVVIQRSLRGQYPRLESGRLHDSITSQITNRNGEINGHVMTPVDYGEILENKLDRSFLLRTVLQQQSAIRRILVRPM